jgi:hypothetical protein
MRKGIAVCCALVATIPSVASAQSSWIRIAEDASLTVWFLDVSSIKHAGNTVRFWTKHDHSKNRDVAHREDKKLWRMDCAADTVQLLSYTQYNANGGVVSSQTIPEYSSYTKVQIPPGTIAADIQRIVCG